MITDQYIGNHLVDDAVMSNDDAMDAFRSKFPLVNGCNVSEDGNMMTFSFRPGQMTLALKMLTEAQTIIGFLNLPLNARLEPMSYTDFVLTRSLQIIYNPNKK